MASLSNDEFRILAGPLLEAGVSYALIGEKAGGISRERVRQRIHQDPELLRIYRSKGTTKTVVKQHRQRFGECLVAIRHRLSLTQEELGLLLGRARVTVSRWEVVHGRGCATLESIQDTAEKLAWANVTVAWLMGERGAIEPVIGEAEAMEARRRLTMCGGTPVGPAGIRSPGKNREAAHTPNLLKNLLLRVERLEAIVNTQAAIIGQLEHCLSEENRDRTSAKIDGSGQGSH